jgi:hypothetical protein
MLDIKYRHDSDATRIRQLVSAGHASGLGTSGHTHGLGTAGLTRGLGDLAMESP